MSINELKAKVSATAKAVRDHRDTHGNGYNPHQDAHKAAVSELVEAEIQHVVDNYEAYRAAWNAEVAKHTTKKGVPCNAIKMIEKAAGVKMLVLDEAKSRVKKAAKKAAKKGAKK